ncbi:hypothetical protein H9L19_04350 [Weissella diestrammenae]|uniref:Hydrophobic protein n=1 Tax=Weissella diestrammenae TaxID=1162633 RepID=A0A7G9T3J7_9LACO|nr:hypothetical protein [Weissella diestrammenae]MCM0582643.1 hypothetical protein [Weissella diestrammenae]QNN74672.1 hypothetical protein H9L19_04350 [Weissella diestrammenae]
MSATFFIILIYFIRKQFKFEYPKRFQYLILPIITAYLLFTGLPHRPHAWLSVSLIFIIGALIGTFQGVFAQFKIPDATDNRPETILIKGGWPYLLGWLIIFSMQLLIISYLAHEAFSPIDTLRNLILEEILPFRRIGGENWWPLYALSTSAGFGYTATLAYRSRLFRQTIQRHTHQKKHHVS